LAGTYDPGAARIEINPGVNRGRVIDLVRKQHGVDLDPDEVILWIFFHELGHHAEAERIRKKGLNPMKFELSQNFAERFAFEKFKIQKNMWRC